MNPFRTDDRGPADSDDSFLLELRSNDHRIGAAARRMTPVDRDASSPPSWLWDRILDAAESGPCH